MQHNNSMTLLLKMIIRAEPLHAFLKSSPREQKFSLHIVQLFLNMVLVISMRPYNSNELVYELDSTIHDKFENYLANPNMVLFLLVVLHPSLKVDFIRFYFHTNGDNVEAKMRELI